MKKIALLFSILFLISYSWGFFWPGTKYYVMVNRDYNITENRIIGEIYGGGLDIDLNTDNNFNLSPFVYSNVWSAIDGNVFGGSADGWIPQEILDANQNNWWNTYFDSNFVAKNVEDLNNVESGTDFNYVLKWQGSWIPLPDEKEGTGTTTPYVTQGEMDGNFLLNWEKGYFDTNFLRAFNNFFDLNFYRLFHPAFKLNFDSNKSIYGGGLFIDLNSDLNFNLNETVFSNVFTAIDENTNNIVDTNLWTEAKLDDQNRWVGNLDVTGDLNVSGDFNVSGGVAIGALQHANRLINVENTDRNSSLYIYQNSGGGASQYGVYISRAGDNAGKNSYGVYAKTGGDASSQFGGYFSSSPNSDTVTNSYAVYAQTVPFSSTITNQYGGFFQSAHVAGTSGTSYGIFADATGGNANYAGYFDDGNVHIKNALYVGDDVNAAGVTSRGDLNIGRNIYTISDRNIGVFPDGSYLSFSNTKKVMVDGNIDFYPVTSFQSPRAINYQATVNNNEFRIWMDMDLRNSFGNIRGFSSNPGGTIKIFKFGLDGAFIYSGVSDFRLKYSDSIYESFIMFSDGEAKRQVFGGTNPRISFSSLVKMNYDLNVVGNLRVDKNVGVGTVAPQAKLEVSGTGTFMNVHSKDKAKGMWTQYKTDVGQDYSIGSKSDSFYIMKTSSNNFDPWNGTKLLYIKDNGDLNIFNDLWLDENIMMKSPNGTYWNCGVTNGGVFQCNPR